MSSYAAARVGTITSLALSSITLVGLISGALLGIEIILLSLFGALIGSVSAYIAMRSLRREIAQVREVLTGSDEPTKWEKEQDFEYEKERDYSARPRRLRKQNRLNVELSAKDLETVEWLIAERTRRAREAEIQAANHAG